MIDVTGLAREVLNGQLFHSKILDLSVTLPSHGAFNTLFGGSWGVRRCAGPHLVNQELDPQQLAALSCGVSWISVRGTGIASSLAVNTASRRKQWNHRFQVEGK